MAVDLTPRFRRLNSQTRSFRETAQHGKILVIYVNALGVSNFVIYKNNHINKTVIYINARWD